VRQVVHDGQPILLVVHDADDGGWQFLTGDSCDVADAMAVSLASVVGRDLSLVELADLPVGWQAWCETRNHPWQRGPCETGGA
jgi:hypothetical protein